MTDRPKELKHFEAQLQRLGLDPAEVQQHATLLKDAVERQTRPSFKIVDTCRIGNGAVLPQRPFADTTYTTDAAGFVAFIPTAGAASRYSQPLFQIVSALEDFDPRDEVAATASLKTVEDSLMALKREGALAWPLPSRVHDLIENPTAARTLDAAQRETLLADLQLPKALLPCVAEGTSFLQMKLKEHGEIPGLVGQTFVVPAGRTATFVDEIGEVTPKAQVLEQGPALSTIRFTADVRPYVDDAGHLSPVPAGHGALARLFPVVGKTFPTAHSLFIRNIDNIMGTKTEARRATLEFLAVHRRILECVQRIRSALAEANSSRAAEIARTLLATVPPAPAILDAAKLLTQVSDPSLRSLWELQIRLFHTLPSANDEDHGAPLRALYDRPVNTMGQVPNTGNDVGGTPCFVTTPNGGALRKLCIEVPHASEADKRDFLANAAKATHFNPVFTAAEITADATYYSRLNDDFWLLSEKSHRGRKVLYFETVLFELLGNSQLANAAFVEVPRLVFHPHKTLKDGCDKSLSDWLA